MPTNKKMRILFVHDHLFLGGAAKAALRMRRMCSDLGHETLSLHGDEASLPGLSAMTVHGKGSRAKRFWEAFLPSKLRTRCRQERATKAFETFLKKKCFDLVWFQNIEGAKKWGWSESWLAVALAHGKAALTLHDMYYLGSGGSYFWDRPLKPTRLAGMEGRHVRELIRAGRLRLNACSSWLGVLCEELYGAPCDKLMVPLWPEDFGTHPRNRAGSAITRYLVAADNLQDPRKNILPTLRCLLQSGILERTRSVIHCLGRNLPDDFRAPHIVFLGHLENSAQYRALYNEVDFLLHPSLLDNFPLVIQESLAQGCPVVALNRGGVGEMIRTGKTGLLYQATDQETLEEIFQKCSRQDPEEYRVWSEECRNFAREKFSAVSVTADYQAFLAPLSYKSRERGN